MEAVIYTTPLHTPAAPLRRVGFPFAGQMIAPAGYQNMVNRGNALFGGMLSSESWAESQAYYLGHVNGAQHFRCEVLEGHPIDTRRDFGALPKNASRKPRDPTWSAAAFRKAQAAHREESVSVSSRKGWIRGRLVENEVLALAQSRVRRVSTPPRQPIEERHQASFRSASLEGSHRGDLDDPSHYGLRDRLDRGQHENSSMLRQITTRERHVAETRALASKLFTVNYACLDQVSAMFAAVRIKPLSLEEIEAAVVAVAERQVWVAPL